MKHVEAGPQEPSEAAPEPQFDVERRQALRRLAVYGAYTAPALLAILKGDKVAAQASLPPPS